MKRAVQGVLVFRSWGGRRRGAGRPPARARRTVAHRRRAAPDPRTPVHVTLRAVAGIASLRGAHVFGAVRRALAAASRRTFRLVHYSVQSDHVHLLVEAEGGTSLARGCQGLSVRVAKAVNRVLGRRGAVWGDRYHARPLRTPREVRNALVYVLQNWFKHVPGSSGRDPLSRGWAGCGTEGCASTKGRAGRRHHPACDSGTVATSGTAGSLKRRRAGRRGAGRRNLRPP
jgi:REP-associated tyrosine transposase